MWIRNVVGADVKSATKEIVHHVFKDAPVRLQYLNRAPELPSVLVRSDPACANGSSPGNKLQLPQGFLEHPGSPIPTHQAPHDAFCAISKDLNE